MLLGGNLLLLVPMVLPERRAWVTHVGLDSLSYFIPINRAASTYRNGRWQPGLNATRIAPEPIDYVTLAPRPTYGQFLRVIRDLKRRGRCNVLIHYPGIPIVKPEVAGAEIVFDVPALVLCGDAIGDAGINEPVPADGFGAT